MPQDLEQLILSCLAKRPEDRPQRAAELNQRLAGVDVAAWTEVQAQQWWAGIQASAGDLDGTVETRPGGHVSGERETGPAADLREVAGARTQKG